jgi:L-fuconolactonase
VIIDAHIHFWRLARGDNTALDATMGPLLADHEPAVLRPLLDACGVGHIVVVQAAETLAETLYTIGLAAATPWIAGVVGWIDLQSASLCEEVAALCRTGLLRGFRPVRDDNRSIAWLLDARNTAGLEAIADAGLVLDVLVQNPDELPLVTHLAARHPELAMVLDHCGKPDVATRKFQPWADDLAALARHRHVACKLSGLLNRLGPGDDDAELEPYAAHVLRCFGASRTLWASDWPPLLLAGDYARWWAVTGRLLAPLDDAERAAVLGGTAARVYRLLMETTT